MGHITCLALEAMLMSTMSSHAITVEPHDEVVHVVIKAKLLDSSSAGDLESVALHAAQAGRGRTVVIDMTQVQYMSSMAIGVLVKLMKELRHVDQRLMIVGVRQQIRQVLAITKVDRVLELCEKLSDAVARLAPMKTEKAA